MRDDRALRAGRHQNPATRRRLSRGSGPLRAGAPDPSRVGASLTSLACLTGARPIPASATSFSSTSTARTYRIILCGRPKSHSRRTPAAVPEDLRGRSICAPELAGPSGFETGPHPGDPRRNVQAFGPRHRQNARSDVTRTMTGLQALTASIRQSGAGSGDRDHDRVLRSFAGRHSLRVAHWPAAVQGSSYLTRRD